MLRRTLWLILISTPLCAGRGAIQGSGEPSIEELANHCLLRIRQRKAAHDKKKQAKNEVKLPVPGNAPAAPAPLEQILEEQPAQAPEQPRVTPPQPTPSAPPEFSRGGGSLFGLAAVGFLAICYNGYQSRKRPPNNILHEKEPSRLMRPIFTQQ